MDRPRQQHAESDELFMEERRWRILANLSEHGTVQVRGRSSRSVAPGSCSPEALGSHAALHGATSVVANWHGFDLTTGHTPGSGPSPRATADLGRELE